MKHIILLLATMVTLNAHADVAATPSPIQCDAFAKILHVTEDYCEHFATEELQSSTPRSCDAYDNLGCDWSND